MARMVFELSASCPSWKFVQFCNDVSQPKPSPFAGSLKKV